MTSATLGLTMPIGATHELTATCRSNLLVALEGAPFSDVLVPFFERGKMLRSALVFTTTAAVGGDPLTAMPAAEAVELLHGASLIHDDIADEADARRGVEAVHRQVPRGTAVVLGDFLIFHALSRLVRGSALGGDACVRAMELLTLHAEQCCRGQIDELHDVGTASGEEPYLCMVARKTGSLFVVACQLGPVLAGAAEAHVTALGRYGRALGIAFQIRDDLLDLVGDSLVLGKPVGNSLQNHRALLPVVYLWQHGSCTAKARFRELTNSEAAPLEVARLLDREGLIARARHAQRSHAIDAAEALASLPASESRATLAALAHSLRTGPQLDFSVAGPLST